MELEKEIKIRLGCRFDDCDKLVELCYQKAKIMENTGEAFDGLTIEFWTNGVSEFIGLGTFTKKPNGRLEFNLDTSESTC